MAGRPDHLGAGERAVPPLQGEGVGFVQRHLCGAKGCFGRSHCRGQRVTFGLYHLGGAVGLIGQYLWTQPRNMSGQ